MSFMKEAISCPSSCSDCRSYGLAEKEVGQSRETVYKQQTIPRFVVQNSYISHSCKN